MAETDGAASLKDQVGQRVHDQTEQVKTQAQQAVQSGQQAAGNALNAGRSHLKTLLTGQKDRAATAVGDIGVMLDQVSNQLKDQGQAGGAQIAGNAAAKINQISDAVHQKDVDELISDTESFARAQPAVFLTIATILGFILARFLKSSGQAATA